MSTRKLNRRQKWRIDKIQQERLARAHTKQANVEQTIGADVNNFEVVQECLNGVVVSHYGATLDIRDLQTGQIFRCALRQNIEAIVCGDSIVWQKTVAQECVDQQISDEHSSESMVSQSDIQGVVTAMQERRSVLARPDFNGLMKPVAANIDQMLIVTAPLPEFNEGLIDRYLVAAELSHIKPVLVINKIDNVNDEQFELLKQRAERYRNIGYQTVYTSAITANGLSPLFTYLTGKTSVFVGQSGVGKSSLINAILPEANAKIGKISDANRKGRHTTSVSRLYNLNLDGVKDGALIDSPGIREFGLWGISKTAVMYGFVEFASHLHCKFRNCKHIDELGCSLIKAMEAGHISQQRLDSYHRIVDSIN